MFCAQCGQLVAEGMKFCPHCGVPVTAVPPPVVAAASETAPATSQAPQPDVEATGPGAPPAGLRGRVKAILLPPSATWPVIAAEPSSAGAIYGRYVAPLAAIGVVAA